MNRAHPLLLLLVLAAPAAAQQQGEPAQELIERAEKRIGDKDYAGAIELLDRALTLDGTKEVAFYLRGQARHLSGKLEEAVRDYSEALARVPGYHQAIHNRGVANTSLGRLDEAIADFTELARIKPEMPEAYYMRACALVRKGEEGEAIADCTMAIRLRKEFPQAFFVRGGAKLSSGDPEGAAADLEQAGRLAPRVAVFHLAHARALRHAGRLEAAKAAYDQAIALSAPGAGVALSERELPRAHSGRGQLLLLLGQREAGIAALRQAVALAPTRGYLALWLALVTGEREPLERASAPDEGAERPAFMEDLLRFARGEASGEDLVKAAEAAEEPKEKQGRVCQAHVYIALRLEREGDAAGARRHYQAAVDTGARLFVEHHWARTRLASGQD